MDLKNLKTKKRRGFTLAEMVMVVTILGILSSMAFMKYLQVQEKAQINADYVAASSLATAVNMAALDNKVPDGTVSLQKLKNDKYIVSIPKPQSTKGDFLVTLDSSNSDIKVKAGGTTFYPKP